MLWHAALIAATTFVTHFRRVRHRERHRLPARRASGKDLMVGIDQVDQNLVLAGWHPGDVDCIGAARGASRDYGTCLNKHGHCILLWIRSNPTLLATLYFRRQRTTRDF